MTTAPAPVAEILGELAMTLAEAFTHAASRLSGTHTDVEVDEFADCGYLEEKRVKRARILMEVRDEGGKVSPATLSEIAFRNGINPQGTAGYFVGKTPSLVSDKPNNLRVLTKHGKAQIAEAIATWPQYFS